MQRYAALRHLAGGGIPAPGAFLREDETMARICDVAGCGSTAKKVLITVEEFEPYPNDVRTELGTERVVASDLCERHCGLLNDHLRQLGFI